MRTCEPDRRMARLTWGLLGLLLVVVMFAGAYQIAPLFLAPRLHYVDTLIQYVATSGGQQPVEWIVRLETRGELIEARCLSEREAVRLRDATR